MLLIGSPQSSSAQKRSTEDKREERQLPRGPQKQEKPKTQGTGQKTAASSIHQQIYPDLKPLGSVWSHLEKETKYFTNLFSRPDTNSKSMTLKKARQISFVSHSS